MKTLGTNNVTVTTTPLYIVAPSKGQLVDILIQNLSANNVYLGTDASVTINNGVKIVQNGSYSNDKRADPVWLIADAAGSDVRIEYEVYGAGER